MRNRTELISNIAFGLSFFWWAFAGLVLTEDAFSPVRFAIALLHITAGILIIVRKPVRITASAKEMLLCIPALVSAGIVFSFSRPTDDWPPWIQVLFWAGTLWTIYSFSFLGNNFAVFPSMRSIVVRGPYRLVRHPAYLGELLLLLCCGLVAFNLGVVLAIGFAVATIVLRVQMEEKLLVFDEGYRQYQVSVRWRLLPGVW